MSGPPVCMTGRSSSSPWYTENEELRVNKDQIAGRWQQTKGRLKERWGKLTDDQLDQLEGRWEQLAGVIQEQYGVAREQIQEDLTRYRKEYEAAGPPR